VRLSKASALTPPSSPVTAPPFTPMLFLWSGCGWFNPAVFRSPVPLSITHNQEIITMSKRLIPLAVDSASKYLTHPPTPGELIGSVVDLIGTFFICAFRFSIGKFHFAHFASFPALSKKNAKIFANYCYRR
jgi:hypothetical protein